MNNQTRFTLTESGFLFDHTTGLTYTLNSSGHKIMQMLLEHKDADEVIKSIIGQYEVDEKEARFDIEQFVQQIKKFDLL